MTGVQTRAARVGATVGRHGALITAAVVFGYPMLWMIFGSLKPADAFYDHIWAPPSQVRWSNFADAWSLGQLGRYYLNSIVVTGVTLALLVVLAYPLAYAIARLQFPGARIVLAAFAICLFVPLALMIIPLFDLVYRLHIYDTYYALILPAVAGSMPFAVIFVTAYLRSLPKEIEEAAWIDGAGPWRTMLQVAIPLSRPAFATIVVFTFLNVWNDFIVPLTLAQSDSVRTLPVGLMNFKQVNGQIEYPTLFAALAMSALPVIALFVMCQRQFLNGLMAGAVKL